MISIISSVRLPRVWKSWPSNSNSSFDQPTPMVSTTRLSEMTAAVETALATIIGLRIGRTKALVVKRKRLVMVAKAPIITIWSGQSVNSGQRREPSAV